MPAYPFLVSKIQAASSDRNASNYIQIQDLTAFAAISTTNLTNSTLFRSNCLFTPIYQCFELRHPPPSAGAGLFFG